jgi:hypothetical protein
MLSYSVAVTHNSSRPAPSAATIKSRPATRLFAPRKSKFLIATPRLEFPPTHTKQTPLTFSNREYIAVFQFFSRRPALLLSQSSRRMDLGAPIDDKFGRAVRTAGIPAGAFSFSRLIASHSSPIAPFLIETPRLEFPANATKQSSDPISNRDKLAICQLYLAARADSPKSLAQPANTHPVSHLTHLRPRTTIVRSSLHRNFYRDLR